MKLSVYIFIILIISCTNKRNKIQKTETQKVKIAVKERNKSIDELYSYVLNYKPSTIDLSTSDLFNKFDINYIFNKNNSIKLKNSIVYMLLLKQYLYHLTRANQGYDIKSMRNGEAKILINYFFKLKKVNTSNETINTSIAYDILKKDKTLKDKKIEDIILKIDKEISRINKETNKIINAN